MIRGYNFPSGTAEKVTIDGNKVREKLDLYTHSYTLVETSDTNNLPTFSGTKQILNDNNFIYYSTSYNSSTYVLTITLRYVTNTPLAEKSSISITTNTVGSCESRNIRFHQNSETNKFWVVVTYKCYSSSTGKKNTYFSVYEISISSSGVLTSTPKCTNIMSYCPIQHGVSIYEGRVFSDLLVDSTGLYVVEAHSSWAESNSFGEDRMELTTYQFGTTNTQMKKIGTIKVSSITEHSGFLLKKGNNQYYYFYDATATRSGTVNSYISITRSSTTSISMSSITTMTGSLYTYNGSLTMYEYNGEFYGFRHGSCRTSGDITSGTGPNGAELFQVSGSSWTLKKLYDKSVFGDNYTKILSISGRIMELRTSTSNSKYYQQNIYVISSFSNGDYILVQTPQLNTYNGIKSYNFHGYTIEEDYYKIYLYASYTGDSESYNNYEQHTISRYNMPLLYSTIII